MYLKGKYFACFHPFYAEQHKCNVIESLCYTGKSHVTSYHYKRNISKCLYPIIPLTLHP